MSGRHDGSDAHVSDPSCHGLLIDIRWSDVREA